jgi:vancomycin permeability regulator SanA
MRLWRVTVALACVFAVLVFAPWLALGARYHGRIYGTIEDVPVREYGVVLGAYVRGDGALSDAARERAEAAVRLYHAGRIAEVFVSGDDRSNLQAQAIADYVRGRGVAAEAVLVDGLGIDTHDTCRHLAALAPAGILLTQEYHLPRAMLMCERDGVDVVGLAVNRLGILETRGESAFGIRATRVSRFVRESLLTWAFVLGIYDAVSGEAEALERVEVDSRVREEGVVPVVTCHAVSLGR